METEKLKSFFDELLRPQDFNDYAYNGLQVEGKKEIKKIAFGVSGSLELFKRAVDIGADAVVVHHGLIWGGVDKITGILRNRLKILLENDINLFAYHLPLDAHPKIGNNAVISKKLGLKNKYFFAPYGGREIGIVGSLGKSADFYDFEKFVVEKIGRTIYSVNYLNKKIKKVAVVSGGAKKDFLRAIESGADVFITGEYGEQVQETARETQKAFIACGHYLTETFGILELKKRVEKKFPSIKSFFIDIPNKA